MKDTNKSVKYSQDTEREHLMQLAITVLHTSGWEDNPRDKNRTMANMQMASIHYIDERLQWMDQWPIYVEDENNQNCMVGIEQTFDVCASYADGKVIRYIGTIDGMVGHARHHDEYALDENKTANRLGDGWRSMFDMSHQITGYCAASGLVFGFPVMRSHVIGVKVPPSASEDVYTLEPIHRDAEKVKIWANWLRYTVDLYEKYEHNYEDAPRFTHSCNRYFRPCSLMTFCCDSVTGRREQWDEMVPAGKSPSERAIMEG